MSHGATSSVSSPVTGFPGEHYPLVRLFDYGADVLLYDAKPHLAFLLSHAELEVLTEFLKEIPAEDIRKNHAHQFTAEQVGSLLTKYAELKRGGVLIPGPAAAISPEDPTTIREQLSHFQENILLRKFCLGVTEDCNFRCTYCKRTIGGGYATHSKAALSEENARKAIDYYFRKYTSFFERLDPDKRNLLLEISPPGLSWYGGEPFLNFALIRATAAYIRDLPWEQHGIPAASLRFTSNTNLSILNEEILAFLIGNRVLLYASLDGPA
jgi:uncharacterized protein